MWCGQGIPRGFGFDRRSPYMVEGRSPEVAEPVAVHYGFRDYPPGNLGNIRGLPLVPFRTNDF